MTLSKRGPLPLALAALALVASGCAWFVKDDDVHREGPPTATFAEGSHDGAVPMAVLDSWITFMRAGKGEDACGLVTHSYGQGLVGDAMSYGADPTRSCARAVEFLATGGYAPLPVAEYVVDTATDHESRLRLVRKSHPEQIATLHMVKGRWLISSVRYAPEPT